MHQQKSTDWVHALPAAQHLTNLIVLMYVYCMQQHCLHLRLGLVSTQPGLPCILLYVTRNLSSSLAVLKGGFQRCGDGLCLPSEVCHSYYDPFYYQYRFQCNETQPEGMQWICESMPASDHYQLLGSVPCVVCYVITSQIAPWPHHRCDILWLFILCQWTLREQHLSVQQQPSLWTVLWGYPTRWGCAYMCVVNAGRQYSNHSARTSLTRSQHPFNPSPVSV